MGALLGLLAIRLVYGDLPLLLERARPPFLIVHMLLLSISALFAGLVAVAFGAGLGQRPHPTEQEE